MATKLMADPRIDPRIKAMMGGWPTCRPRRRQGPRAAAGGGEHARGQGARRGARRRCSTRSTTRRRALHGPDIRTVSSRRSPTATRQHPVHPARGPTIAAVRLLHPRRRHAVDVGFHGMYRAWGRIIAGQGVAVAMVDFRNCLQAVVGARGRAVPGRPQRLRLGPEVGGGQPRGARHRSRRGSSSPARAAAATSPSPPA